MLLDAYLRQLPTREERESIKENIARELNTSVCVVNYWRMCFRRPRDVLKAHKVIEKWTNGQVSVEDLLCPRDKYLEWREEDDKKNEIDKLIQKKSRLLSRYALENTDHQKILSQLKVIEKKLSKIKKEDV